MVEKRHFFLYNYYVGDSMKKIKILMIVLLLLVTGCSFNKEQEYKLNLYYMDTYIYVDFYCDDSKKCDNIKQEIDNIYKYYHELSDRYQEYDNIINLYTINNNTINDKELTLDDKLYDLLSYAMKFQELTNNRFNIEIGNTIDVWKKYRDSGVGIPTKSELDKTKKINHLKLLGDNKILNNKPNLDLGAISKGYTTEVVGKYLEENGITKYLINAGGNVKVGIPNNKDVYSIGIQSPNKDGSLLTIVKGKNISVITSGSYERNYTYNGVTYSHIIDPDTLYPASSMKSVTVITKDSALGDALSTTLFLMSVEDGQKFIKNYDAEAIWVTNSDEVIRSEGFNAYE